MLRLRGNPRSSFGRMFTPRKSNGSDEDNPLVETSTEGLAPFRSSPFRHASERVTSMSTALNQARDWIATKGHLIDERDDQYDHPSEGHSIPDDEVDREPDQEGYFTDGEGEEDDPYAEDAANGDEVEHLMLAACEKVSQDTERGSIGPVYGDTSPGKTKTIPQSFNNVTTRQRPPRPKRVTTKMEDRDGSADLHEPLPKREREKVRTEANFTYLNDMKRNAKVTASGRGRGSARKSTRPLKKHMSPSATGTLPPRIRNGILHAPKNRTSRDKRSQKNSKRSEPNSSSDVTSSSSEEADKANSRSSTQSSKRSDGNRANKRNTSMQDKCFSRYPAGKKKIDLQKKALPYKDLSTLAKEMFRDQGHGKSFLDNFFEKVYEVITKDSKSYLSLLDLESNILHYLQRNGIISREEITGLSVDNAFAKRNSVLEAAKQRTLAANNIIPQSQKSDQKYHHVKATTTSNEEVKILLEEHFQIMEDLGLGDMGDDTYHLPRIISDHVDFFNWHQKRMADAIFYIVKELSKLNEDKPNNNLGAINVILRTLETLTESTPELYCPLAGIMITPLDSVLGSTYLGYEARLVLAKTKKASLVTDKLPVQIQYQLLGLPQEGLNEDIGAYAAAQVFLKAVQQLSDKESNPANNPLLTPIEFNKNLYSMLNNIHQTNPYLLELIEALKESITKEGPTGDQELATLVTVHTSDNAEQSTMVITVDGSPVKVLKGTYVVAPNSVYFRGKKISSKNDWITALENLESEGLWVANPKGKVDTKPMSILNKISRKADNHHDRPNFKSNGKSSRPYVNICKIQCEVEPAQLNEKGREKLTRAKKLLLEGLKGGSPKSRKESINKLSRLKDSQRKSLQDHANVSFQDERDGQRRFNTSKALPLSNDLIASQISAETLAAYMLATYSYPADIADAVEQRHSLKPSERKGPEKRVHVAQEDQNPDQSSGDDQPSGEQDEPTPPTKSQRTSKKKKSKSSSSNVQLTDDGKHIFHDGRLYSLHSDSASSDDGSDDSGKSNRSKRSGGDSDNSQFDQDSGSDDSADKSHRKSKSKKKRRGKN